MSCELPLGNYLPPPASCTPIVFKTNNSGVNRESGLVLNIFTGHNSEEEPQIANGLSRRTRPLFSFSRSLFALFFASEELPETPPLRGELALLLAHSLRGSDTRGV